MNLCTVAQIWPSLDIGIHVDFALCHISAPAQQRGHLIHGPLHTSPPERPNRGQSLPPQVSRVPSYCKPPVGTGLHESEDRNESWKAMGQTSREKAFNGGPRRGETRVTRIPSSKADKKQDPNHPNKGIGPAQIFLSDLNFPCKELARETASWGPSQPIRARLLPKSVFAG